MTSRSNYGYSGNGGNTQQPAVLWQAGASAWDAAATGVKGDATAVVNLYRRKMPAVQTEQQPRPPLPPSQTMAAMAAPPPPMAIPAWLQRRKAILPSAAEARPAPNLQPPHAPAPPCPLRPCPPSSTGPGSLRVESFTAGTGGRLMRPGVGIGAGLMREARYSDLRFIHQIGEGGFGKVRGDERLIHSSSRISPHDLPSKTASPVPRLLTFSLSSGTHRCIMGTGRVLLWPSRLRRFVTGRGRPPGATGSPLPCGRSCRSSRERWDVGRGGQGETSGGGRESATMRAQLQEFQREVGFRQRGGRSVGHSAFTRIVASGSLCSSTLSCQCQYR